MSQLTYLHFHLLRSFGIFWAVSGNAGMITTGISTLQHDRIGYFVSKDLKWPGHQLPTEESKGEDTFESIAILIDDLFIGWVLIFVFAAMTKAWREHEPLHTPVIRNTVSAAALISCGNNAAAPL